jgi:glycosyltransferase involved in cell wall biosynthesis
LRFLLPRKKVFMTFHGYSDYPVPKIAIIYQKIAKKLTKGNITIGKVIEKWFGIKADIISYGAVDLEKFKPVKKKKFKYDAVFASRLDDQTGILTYLDALAILKEKGVEFKLVILGDGKYKSKADKLALTHGWVADPSPYFKESRFAFVNRYLGILEAFASKKLVFSVYDNPIKKDYIYLTPFKNWMIVEEKPERLAQKILYYKDKPLKTRDMIESAYFWVKNQTWEKMVDNYIKLWST